jgi:hypothetical protein
MIFLTDQCPDGEQKKLKCFPSVSPDDSYSINEITTTMFSFLQKGDINNTIRSITNLPSLFTSDGDKIKYSALNYATAMRKNISAGNPIFENISSVLADIERRDIASITSGRLPTPTPPRTPMGATTTTTLSPFTDNDIIRDNATLALIMAKELAFLNRTIQMISLIACRYQEEQEDAHFQMTRNDDHDDHDDHDDQDHDHDDDPDDEDYIEDDTVYSTISGRGPGILERSSHSSYHNTEDDYRGRAPENQLVATFLIASGRLQTNFSNLCELVGTSIVVVNAMTTIDQPPNQANHEKQLQAERLVISSIYTEFCRCGPEQRDPIVSAFIELRDISVNAWRIMSMMAFSNLFRLTAGTKFAIHPQHPDDAIFTQGRDYGLPSEKVAEVSFHRTATAAAADAEAEEEEIPEYD